MSRLYAAHLVVALTEQGTVYFGPFRTQEQAQTYAASLPADTSYSIRHLIVPDACHITITEKAATTIPR